MDLSARLAQLRVDKSPAKLSTYLIIVHGAQYECYINYCEGAKLVYDWLTSGSGQLEVDYKGPLITPSRLLSSYYLGQLTEIVSGVTYGSDYDYWKSAIFTTLLHRELL